MKLSARADSRLPAHDARNGNITEDSEREAGVRLALGGDDDIMASAHSEPE